MSSLRHVAGAAGDPRPAKAADDRPVDSDGKITPLRFGAILTPHMVTRLGVFFWPDSIATSRSLVSMVVHPE